MSEVEILETLTGCPFLVPLVGGAVSPRNMCILTEFQELGNLEQYVGQGLADAKMKIRILYDIARGMTVIHEHNIMHRNLKPMNVMMASTDPSAPVVCKLCEFGFSRMFAQGTFSSTMTAGVGSPLYMVCPDIHLCTLNI